MQCTLMTTLEAGDTLDHYRLDATVARSGMATLFKATDLRDGRQVAIKVPHEEMEADPVLVERFRREQEIGQELDHPGVVKTFDGEERSRLYMVIEWVDGRLLRAILNEERKLPIERATQLCAADSGRAGHHAQARRGASRPEAGKHHGGRRRTASS
jgi:serine/threonine protein kinase